MFKYSILILIALTIQESFGQEKKKYDIRAEYHEALKSGKPVVVVVSADWCGACKKMDKEVWKDDKMKDLLKQGVNFFKLNLDDNPDLQTTFGFKSIPSYTIVKDTQAVPRKTTLDKLEKQTADYLKSGMKELSDSFAKDIAGKNEEEVADIKKKYEEDKAKLKKRLDSWKEEKISYLEKGFYDYEYRDYETFGNEPLDIVLKNITKAGVGEETELKVESSNPSAEINTSPREGEGYADSIIGKEKTAPEAGSSEGTARQIIKQQRTYFGTVTVPK